LFNYKIVVLLFILNKKTFKHYCFYKYMGLVSKILSEKEPELRDYIFSIAVVSALGVGGAYLLVESNIPKKVYNSAIDLAYLVISDYLSR